MWESLSTETVKWWTVPSELHVVVLLRLRLHGRTLHLIHFSKKHLRQNNFLPITIDHIQKVKDVELWSTVAAATIAFGGKNK